MTIAVTERDPPGLCGTRNVVALIRLIEATGWPCRHRCSTK